MTPAAKLVTAAQEQLDHIIEHADQLAEHGPDRPVLTLVGTDIGTDDSTAQARAADIINDAGQEVYQAVRTIVTKLIDNGSTELMPNLPQSVQQTHELVEMRLGHARHKVSGIEQRLADGQTLTEADSKELEASLRAARRGVSALSAYARAADDGLATRARWVIDEDSGELVQRWVIELPRD